MSEELKKYRFTGDGKFNISSFDRADTGSFSGRDEAVDEFIANLHEINRLQQKLYAARREGVIFIFQAMDAAGKDGVIRTVFSTLSPHGVKEYCFKVPSSVEQSHDYLWRFWSALPAKGNISIFNRSYYEDVLVGRVHSLYKNQLWPKRLEGNDFISDRYSQIVNFEQYLYDTGTRVVKIFLNVSKDEQARRFISRIDTPKKNWKVSSGDMAERDYWDEYMDAFETMVNKTSTSHSPWYVVPADSKWYARLTVSRIVVETLREMAPEYPDVDEAEAKLFAENRAKLAAELGISDAPAEPAEKPKKEKKTKADKVFAKADSVTEDIIKDEEEGKIKKEKKSAKKASKAPADDDSGFDAVSVIAREAMS